MSTSVLVIDDDFDICEAYAEALSAYGYHVATACNGRAALLYLDEAEAMPAAILVDLMMPVMDGIGFVTELRRRGRYDDVPVIVMTANRSPPAVDGATFLLKPFSLEVLRDALRDRIAD